MLTTWRALIVLAVAAAIGAAPAQAAPPKGPSGLRFYTPPKKLTGQHGDVIRARKDTGNTALSSASRNYLVLYRSTSVLGKKVAVSGDIAIPKGTPPKGGWPVVSWAHGTTGGADICAPSRDTWFSYGMEPEFNDWLKAGYVVARTDYEGLGTPGAHPYLIGTSAARSLTDIVTAARGLDRHVGRRWVAVGASQGGHAALFAGAQGQAWAPKLQLRGVDALAPGSHIKDEVELAKLLKTPSALSVVGALLVSGVIAADPAEFKPAGMLTPQAVALLPQVQTRCQDDLAKPDSWGGIAPGSILKAGYDRTALYRTLDRNDPMRIKIPVPVYVQQGLADLLVFPTWTNAVVDALRGNGAKVTYQTYPGADHGGVVTAGRADTAAWLAKRLG